MSKRLQLVPLKIDSKSGTATASTITTVTFNFVGDILRSSAYVISKRVRISKVILTSAGALSVKIIINGEDYNHLSHSPNFTVVQPFDPPLVLVDDVVILLTESAGSGQSYNVLLVCMQEL